MKVFLGGTCNDSTWRNRLIPMLKVDFFNPVVADWATECTDAEIRMREECEICLYVITPKMDDCYSIAEAVDDSNKRPEHVVFVPLRYDGDAEFTVSQWKSLCAVTSMVEQNGCVIFLSLKDAATYINVFAVKLDED